MATQEDELEVELEKDSDLAIEVEDDTPPEDRGREPMPKEIVEELEADELEEYSEKVKTRLKQMKKVWHDERREKEKAWREAQEAISIAQRAVEENKRLRSTSVKDREALVNTAMGAAELEYEAARREYKEAYEAGDADKVLEAQTKLTTATLRLNAAKSYQAPSQDAEIEVPVEVDAQPIPRPDAKTQAWQERNQWFGTDSEMTASALGLHEKLMKERGQNFNGTDEYWATIDRTMRRRFPEYFGDEAETEAKPKREPKPVVAPVTRSTSPKKVVLKQSELAVAKRLGLTPEQYAREKVKMG